MHRDIFRQSPPNRAFSATILITVLTLSIGCPKREAVIDEAKPVGLSLPVGFEAAESAITATTLEQHTVALSADSMEGRGPGTDGDRRARQYLAETMSAFGIQPAFPDGWEQALTLVSIDSEAPQQWSFSTPDAAVDLRFWDDYIAASGLQSETVAIDAAEVVFVGFGIQAPEHGWNDFKGVDLTGKVLLMLNNDPDWDPDLFEGTRRLYYGRWDYKYESAAAQGAAGAIIVHTTPSAGYPWQVVQTSWTGPQFELPAGEEERVRIKAWVTEEAAAEIVALAGRKLSELVEAARHRDFEPVPLRVTTSLALHNSIDEATSANVGGLLQGSDLAHELVVYTAHHDHYGIGEPDAQGDVIYNGARDNASGCAALLSVAEAFTRLSEPPRRSILFLFVAAEEQGLLGSEYYARNPSFDPARIAANINLDGVNIWGKASDLTYIGYGKSTLDGVVEAAAGRQNRIVKGDQFPDRGHFYRSDQFNFAKIGVPAIYIGKPTEIVGRPEGWGREQMNAWEASHYHQPSDEIDDTWNLDGAVDDTRVAFICGLAVAEDENLPAWNAGDEFEAARLSALEALQ